MGFDFTKVLFGFMFAPFGFQKAFIFTDASKGFFTDGQLEIIFDPFGTEGWEHAL